MVFSDSSGKKHEVPLDQEGNLLINFYKDLDKFTLYPADQIIASSQNYFSDQGALIVAPDTFRNKIVIIGSSAVGLKDLKVTPMGKNIPGPYLHINAISTILNDQLLKTVPRSGMILICFFVLLPIIGLMFFLNRHSAGYSLGAILVLLSIAAPLLLFRFQGLILNFSALLASGLIPYFASLAYLSFSETKEKNRISIAMSKYLAPAVMTEVLDKYDELIGEVGEDEELAILFSDIRGFTTVSESFPAATVVEILNRYLKEMIDVVFENRGTLDKIIGDAIMAFWGAPGREEQKEVMAVKTALEMIERLCRLNETLIADGYNPLKIGVGINTGNMIVGNIGSEKRLDYTAIGDNVNLGSRIEGLTKYYKVPVLVSGSTYEKTKDKFVYLFVDSVAVKGKDEGVDIYAPIGEMTEELFNRLYQSIRYFAEARELYLNGSFKTAGLRFAELSHSELPFALLSEMYMNKCGYLLQNKPEGEWKGMWKMVEK